ncbi:MAG: efflux RND transporter periplasmic adaptor subunit [Acidobacteriota bacterium]
MRASPKLFWIAIAAALVACAGGVIAMNRPMPARSSDSIPTAVVKRGALDLRVYATGALTASHVAMVVAPPIGGDSLQITELAHTGQAVKKGDLVANFDPSEQRYKWEQSHSELLQAQQEITKAKADAAVLAAQDKVALLKAQYGVRSAELDVEKNELLSKIDADKNDLALREARRTLAELQNDIESHRLSGKASIFLAQEKYNKAKLSMDQAQQHLDHMRVTAPMDGLISVQKNQMASGGFYFTGMSLPDYRPGDQVYPGNAIAEILDPTGLNLTAKVAEGERENVKQGEAVEVRFDALPNEVFHGVVKTVGGMSTQSIFGDADTSHGFDVTIDLSSRDGRLRPGLTAQLTFLGDRKANVLYVPRLALFMKDGKRVVYVGKGGSYHQREVKVEYENESRAAVTGLRQGNTVALVDPTAPRKQAAGGSSTAGLGGAL